MYLDRYIRAIKETDDESVSEAKFGPRLISKTKTLAKTAKEMAKGVAVTTAAGTAMGAGLGAPGMGAAVGAAVGGALELKNAGKTYRRITNWGEEYKDLFSDKELEFLNSQLETSE